MGWFCFCALSMVVVVSFGIGAITGARNDKDICVILVILFGFLASLLGLIKSYNVYAHDNEPTALDVYRGNTTLKIEFTVYGQDTIPGDTTVIFKNQIIKFE